MRRSLPASRAQTVALIRAAQRSGSRARAAQACLVDQHRGLVISIVRRYDPAGLPAHVERDDLISAGTLGLLRAVAKFDADRGTALSTYAVPWIRQSIQRFMEEQADLSVSVHQVQRRKRIRRAVEAFSRAGAVATEADLCAATGLSAIQVRRVQLLPRVAASLDQPLPSEEGCLADAVPDSVQSAAISGAEHRCDRRSLAEFLERSLPPRQALVLRLMAGLHPEHPGGLTRRQIAARMGVSGTRVSMLVQDAAARLTATPQRAAALRALLGGHE